MKPYEAVPLDGINYYRRKHTINYFHIKLQLRTFPSIFLLLNIKGKSLISHFEIS